MPFVDVIDIAIEIATIYFVWAMYGWLFGQGPHNQLNTARHAAAQIQN
jgi:hypothetical protein